MRTFPVRSFPLPLILTLASPLAAQDQPYEPTQPVQPAPTLAPDAMTLAAQAYAKGDAAEALSRYLRVIAATPDNVAALAGAGKAALAVGDLNAATGFFARADALDPRNGSVKAGLAATELQKGDGRAALRLFNQATELGVPIASIASDRGLAYDLRGSFRHAQADYQLALHARPDDRETVRRLALSQAMAGDRAAALATLDPLLRVQDVPAWRARAFVYALTGDTQDALSGAALVMPKDQVDALAPYVTRLATLKAQDKAAAIHLGRFPGEGPPPAQASAANAAKPKLKLDRQALSAAPAAAPAEPTPPPPPAQTAATDPAAEAAAANARQQPHRMTRAERLAEARAKKKDVAEKAQKLAERKNPARHWVQVAGGANKRDLGRAWADLRKKWPKQLAGREPWTLHYRYTNRLLIGPFASSEAAQDWVSARRQEGFATFRVETGSGDPVERVKG